MPATSDLAGHRNTMGDSSNSKPGSRAGGVPPATPSAAGQTPQSPAAPMRPVNDPSAGRTGRVVHDERGNAVWDWVKDTAGP